MQVNGAAMKSPLSPIVANLFMEGFERKALKTDPLHPKMWVRYVHVDDTFVVWSHCREELQKFYDHLNSQHPAIQFTMEQEEIIRDTLQSWMYQFRIQVAESLLVYIEKQHIQISIYIFLIPPSTNKYRSDRMSQEQSREGLR